MNPKNSQDLFNKIRSQFSNIRLGDENGAATANPADAVFFEFEFQEDADTFGAVSISLADGENMKVYYNRDLVNKIDEDSRDEWYAFLKELKDFAVEHQLRFDVRDITKNNLSKQDYENLADTNKTVNTDEMSEELARITKLAGVNEAPMMQVGKQPKGERPKAELKPVPHDSDITLFDKDKENKKDKKESVAEGLTGTAKRSYENLDKTKLIIRHKGKVDETVPGARSRQIQSLYIENEDGERFKYPMTHLAGARAMMRHVANGGRPHDEFGQHIIQTSEDIAKLNSFQRYVSNKDQLNDNAGDIIENTKLQLENLREYMRNLSKQSHYESSCKSYKKAEDQVLDDETVNKLREKFTMTNLDSRVEDAFPLISRVMAELENASKEEPINELEPDAEPIDAPVQPPVDHGAVVQSFLNDPDSKLVLRKDDTADKMLQTTKFTNKNTMLSSILSDIASRLLTKSGEEDRVANFASRVADEMEQENSATFKPTPDYIKNKKIAVQLAKRYIDDYKKMQSDPDYGKEVRMDPGAFAPKKDLKGKAKETEAFESWVDSMIDEGGIKPYVSMSRSEATGKMTYNVLDRNEKTIFSSVDQEEAQDFLRQNFDKLRAGEMEVAEVEERDEEDRQEKLKALQDIQMDKHTAKDPELQKELMKRKQELQKSEGMGDKIADMAQSMSKDEFMSKADELGLTPEEAAEHYEKMQGGAHAGKFEGNMFAQAVQKAKAAGMKAGDKFKVGDKEYTLQDAIELAGMQLEDFFSEEEQAYDNQIERITQLANY
jgi:hypothetical protein